LEISYKQASKEGNYLVLKFLVDISPVDISPQVYVVPYIEAAIRQGRLDNLKLFMAEQKIDYTVIYRLLIPAIKLDNMDILTYLLNLMKKFPDLHTTDDQTTNSVIGAAIDTKNVKIIKLFVESGLRYTHL
jgi:hypothetical protein